MKTLNDVITETRQHLQDTRASSYRYTDVELVSLVNTAFIELRRIRPDAFVQGGDIPRIDVPSYVVDDLAEVPPLNFPVESQFFLPIVFMTVAFAQMRDDEFASDGRAMAARGAAEAMLRGA